MVRQRSHPIQRETKKCHTKHDDQAKLRQHGNEVGAYLPMQPQQDGPACLRNPMPSLLSRGWHELISGPRDSRRRCRQRHARGRAVDDGGGVGRQCASLVGAAVVAKCVDIFCSQTQLI